MNEKQIFFRKLSALVSDKKTRQYYFDKDIDKLIDNVIIVPKGLSLDEYKFQNVNTLASTIKQKVDNLDNEEDLLIKACHFNGEFIEFLPIDETNINYFRMLLGEEVVGKPK